MVTVQGNLEEVTPQEFARRMGIKFEDKLLLSRALTHRSYLNENPEALEDYERLEFLGDAVLDFLVSAWLYNRFPEMSEGQLTRLRSALVCTEQLAEFAREMNMGPAIRLGRGEAESGGRDRNALLCAAFEALVGALYLDSGIPAICDFIVPILDAVAYDLLMSGKTRDPKSELQEWAQAQGYAAPIYRTISTIGPDHEKTFEVEVIIDHIVYSGGLGKSKQDATKVAAQKTLRILGINQF